MNLQDFEDKVKAISEMGELADNVIKGKDVRRELMVTDYEMISSNEVPNYLENGWHLYGNPIVVSDSNEFLILQAMILKVKRSPLTADADEVI